MSATVACSSTGAGVIRSHRTEGDTIQALMDLALPQFGVGNHSALVRKPWTVLSSGMSPRPVQWSTDTDRSDERVRLRWLLLQWIRKIVYRVVHTGSRLMPGRHSPT